MNRILSGTLILILVSLDQISKYLAEKNLPFQQSTEFIPFLSFYRTYNKGIAFSTLDFVDNKILVALILAAIIFILWLWQNLQSEKKISHLGFTFIIAGATGNLIDRISLGHVVDFIQFHIHNWSFPIFNLADSFITIGAMFIIMDEFRWRKETGSEAGP